MSKFAIIAEPTLSTAKKRKKGRDFSLRGRRKKRSFRQRKNMWGMIYTFATFTTRCDTLEFSSQIESPNLVFIIHCIVLRKILTILKVKPV